MGTTIIFLKCAKKFLQPYIWFCNYLFLRFLIVHSLAVIMHLPFRSLLLNLHQQTVLKYNRL
jgi:hypothetical protein